MENGGIQPPLYTMILTPLNVGDCPLHGYMGVVLLQQELIDLARLPSYHIKGTLRAI